MIFGIRKMISSRVGLKTRYPWITSVLKWNHTAANYYKLVYVLVVTLKMILIPYHVRRRTLINTRAIIRVNTVSVNTMLCCSCKVYAQNFIIRIHGTTLQQIEKYGTIVLNKKKIDNASTFFSENLIFASFPGHSHVTW